MAPAPASHALLVALAARAPESAAEATDPWFALLPWIEMAGLVAIGALLVVALRILQRLGELGAVLRAQGSALEQIDAHVSRAAAQRGDLDLRRIEHVLIDLRDGQSRLQDALLDKASRRRATDGGGGPEPDPTEALLERVHNRLYALGYERVQLMGERSEIADLVQGRGALAVEAYRGNIVHKGRVLVHAGRILDVEMRPPYAMFP